ncbi:MAG TPA: DUF4118 domain-containing protein [Vicinamibacteria bacterium]|nr:DUF4118 domain-containing protein [Vicinamibacteria bacterium]
MRRPLVASALALAALVAAVLLRWALDPLMGDSLPLVTLFGAVAAAVWLGGYRTAVAVAVLGYLACDYLFIPPRGRLGIGDAGHVVGVAAYLFTCSVIIGFGESVRVAQVRASERGEAARVLASIVESSDDAIIGKSLDGVIQSWNAAAQRLFGYTAEQAVGRHVSLLIPPERRGEEDHIIASLKEGRRPAGWRTRC